MIYLKQSTASQEVLLGPFVDSTDGNTLVTVRAATKACITKMADDLKALGLVVSDAQARKAIMLPLLIAFMAIAASRFRWEEA